MLKATLILFYFYTFKVIDNDNFDLLQDIRFQPWCSQLISAFERPSLNHFSLKFTLLYYYSDNKLILKLQ